MENTMEYSYEIDGGFINGRLQKFETTALKAAIKCAEELIGKIAENEDAIRDREDRDLIGVGNQDFGVKIFEYFGRCISVIRKRKEGWCYQIEGGGFQTVNDFNYGGSRMRSAKP